MTYLPLRFRFVALIATTLAAVTATGWAIAQSYPVKPIRLIVPFSPGGGTDIIARIIGKPLHERLAQPVVIDNRAGADGIIGAEAAAKAAPDGYTLILGTNTTHAVNAVLYPKLPYDPVRDFMPITMVGTYAFILVVHPSVPVKSVKNLIALARAKPRALNYASSGSISRLAGELFKTLAQVDMVGIQYKGGGPLITDLLGGHVDLSFVAMPPVLPHVKSGRLKALAVTSAKRSLLSPELPTMQEAGVSDYEASSWYMLLAPGGTPQAIVARLNQEIISILQVTTVRTSLSSQGAEPVTNSPGQAAAHIRSEIAKWAAVVRVASAKPD